MKLQEISIQKFIKTLPVAIFVFLFSSGFLLFFKNDDGGKVFFMYLCLLAAFYAFHNLNNVERKEVSKGILIGLAGLMFLVLILETIKSVTTDSQWDFLCFYMQGLLGVNKLSFYDPNSFNILFGRINFHPVYDNEFKLEIINVGLLTPPVTMLIYAPMALLDYNTSRIAMSLLVFIFIIADSLLANIVFIKKERSIYSLLFIFILVMLLPGTIATIGYRQTNFFLLFFLILTIHKIDKPISGLYLALSFVFKPITGLLILFFLIHKKWKPVIYFGITGMVLTLITGLIWGFHNIFDFFVSPPTKRLPQYLYEQGNNQSLIAVFNRNLSLFGLTHHIINLLYYLGILFLIVLTCLVSKKLYKINLRMSIYPFILSMLMIYPSSLNHYMVYLIPVLIYFLFNDEYDKYLFIIVMLAFGFLRIESFFTYLILWLVFLYLAFLRTNKREAKFWSDE